MPNGFPEGLYQSKHLLAMDVIKSFNICQYKIKSNFLNFYFFD